MKRLINLLSLIIGLLVIETYAQTQENNFPYDYLGIYKGTLHIEKPNGTMEIPMEFHFQKTDSTNQYQYTLVYNNKPREYTLIVKDQEKGLYEVDENNGIILPVKYNKGVLFSMFEVQGNLITTRMDFRTFNILDFEIFFSNTASKITTKSIGEEPIEVFGYPISVSQTARLVRK
jgi:hypothetical protein